jgi:ribosomal protein S12 methylthiotransferase
MPATVALVSLGCPKNLVDSQAMLGLLEQAGYEIVEDVHDAEVLIVNTCAFIETAEEEAVDALMDLSDYKTGRCRALICTGCLPQRHGEAILEAFTEVDAFVGVAAIPRIVEAVSAALQGHRGFYDAPLSWIYDGSTPRVHTGPAWLSYLKVADGCNHRCAFCTIPAIRGPYRSITGAAVASQYREAIADDVREVCLVAQDTSAWGRDLDPRGHLPALLTDLAAIPFDGWLRLLYLHPDTLSDDLIAAICAGPPLVPYFDIPLQHASPGVLRRMGRAGDAETYLALLQRIRDHNPRAAIRTTFILGFPGETDEDFDALLDFVTEARMDRVSCFPYWPESGTRAAEMPDQVGMELADERLDELMRVQEGISLEINRGFVGQRLRVLLEGPVEGSSQWKGRSYRDAAEIDGDVLVALPGAAAALEPGSFVDVEVLRAQVHDLDARPVPDA